MDGVSLAFTESALERIAEKAKDMGMGARGLKAVVDQPMVDLMFELPSFNGVTEVAVGEEFFSECHEIVTTRTDGTTERITLQESA